MNHDLDLESMSVDQLWSIPEKISRVLVQKISAEKERLERRLLELGVRDANAAMKPVRAVLIRGYIRSIKIPTYQRRRGPAAGNSPDGWMLSSASIREEARGFPNRSLFRS
jgi:hypothetical protein